MVSRPNRRINVVRYNGKFRVCLRGVRGAVIECDTHEEANRHVIVARSFVWMFNKIRYSFGHANWHVKGGVK